eukprot:767137-Hanusia_phi.AAC.17
METEREEMGSHLVDALLDCFLSRGIDAESLVNNHLRCSSGQKHDEEREGGGRGRRGREEQSRGEQKRPASLPDNSAPSIDPRNFCEVQSPARGHFRLLPLLSVTSKREVGDGSSLLGAKLVPPGDGSVD